MIRFEGWLCVPNHRKLRREVLHEAYHLKYTIQPGITKMYQAMKRMYWWPQMKKDVADFISKYLTCQQVKFERQWLGGQLQPFAVPTKKFLDFKGGLVHSD